MNVAHRKDFKDFYIEHLEDEVRVLDDRLVNAEQDIRAYRELASVALERVASLTTVNRKLREQNVTLRDEVRALMGIETSERAA